MIRRELREPQERVGILPNADLPPPNGNPASSETLLRQALVEHDEKAFEAVSRDLEPEMIKIARRYVRTADDAEDVVQDTWLAALRAIGRFEGRASLRTWLLRILSYRARSAGLKASRAVPASQLAEGALAEGDGAHGRRPVFIATPRTPEDELLARELGERLDACVAQLPPRQREVLERRDVEGWSADEVCDDLGLTPENQRVLLHRARSQVRRALASYAGQEREARVA